MAVITIPKPLREKLGDEATDAFTNVIKEIDLDARKEALAIAEERFEKRLSEETGKLRVEIEKLRMELRVEMSSNKSEIIKWMFLFWLGHIGVLTGIIFTMFKLYFR